MEIFNKILLHTYTITHGQFIAVNPANHLLVDLNSVGMFLFFLTNFGLIGAVLSYLLPNRVTVFVLISLFCYQGFQFWTLKSMLSFAQLFPFGVRFKLEEMPYKPNVDYGLFFNALNYQFIIITIVLTILCLCYVLNMKSNNNAIIRLICIINYFSLNVFLVDDLLMFFFFIECSVFPMVYLIYFYGPRVERKKAALTYFYFSILASFLLFIGISIVYCYFKSTTVDNLFINYLFKDYSIILNFKNSPYNELAFFLIFFGLAIKLPIFPFHIWLPEAHGEANTVGSVFLAGTYLKMALYGILNYCVPLFHYELYKYQYLIYVLCFSGAIYCAIILFSGFDLKKFIAYTSVIHMNFTLIAVVNSSALSIYGGIFSAIIHSYVTSTLFFIVGFIYERTHTRNVIYYNLFLNSSAMKNLFKLLTLFLLINASAPIGPTFLGELKIFLSLVSTKPYLAMVLLIAIAIASVAHFLLINKLYGNKNVIANSIFHTKFNNYYQDINLVEYIIIVVLIYFVFRYFAYPTFYLHNIEPYLDVLLESGQYHDVMNRTAYVEIIHSYVRDLMLRTPINSLSPGLLQYVILKEQMLLSNHAYFDDFTNVLYFFKEVQVINYEVSYLGETHFMELFQHYEYKIENGIPYLYHHDNKVNLAEYFYDLNRYVEMKGIPRPESFNYFKFNRPR